MNSLKIIMAAAFIICSNILAAQTLLWEKNYGGAMWESGGIIEQTPDGGYILSGTSNGPSNTKNYFIKTNINGDVMWEKEYAIGMYNSFGVSVTQTPDGGYMGISRGRKNTLCEGLYLLKMDSKGDTVWTKFHGCVDFCESLQKTSDGGYIVTATKKTDIGYRAYLLKLDSMGDKQWENIYGGPYETRGFGVSVNADGTYMLAGRNQINSNDFGAYIAKIKPNGDSLWTRTIAGQGSSYGSCVLQTRDSGYIISGATDSIGNKGGYLIKTDRDGNVKWQKTYGRTKHDYFSWVLKTNDGGYMVAGGKGISAFYPPNYVAGDAYMAKIDSEGNVLWDKYYGGTKKDGGGCLLKTNDGGYLLSGTTWSFGNYSQAYLVKTDSMGSVYGVGIGNQPGAANNSITGFKVFPNPATNSFTIEYNGVFGRETKHRQDLTIYNILGGLVYKDNWPQGQTQKSIDVSSFPKGVYIIRIGGAVQQVVKE